MPNTDSGQSTDISGHWTGSENDSSILYACTDCAMLGDTTRNEATQDLIRCSARIARAVPSCGGRIIKGDGAQITAIFGIPDAALKAALIIQEDVRDLPRVSGVERSVRIGVSHGPVNKDQEESVTGEVVDLATRLALMSEPWQIALCIRAQAGLSPGMVDQYENYTLSYQIPSLAQTEPDDSDVEVKIQSSLLLKHAGKIFRLDENTDSINIGRHEDNDVVVNNNLVSRHHAQIKRHGDKFVLIDKSTNGCFVSYNNQPAFLVRHDIFILNNKGVILFIAPTTPPHADFAEFEIT